MDTSDKEQSIGWNKVSMVLVSLALGALLLCALRRLGEPGGIDGLAEALQIVGVPGALVLIILMPYLAVRSGGEWVEARKAKANFKAESAQASNLSLLRASSPCSDSEELLLRPAGLTGETDPKQMLRAVTAAGAD